MKWNTRVLLMFALAITVAVPASACRQSEPEKQKKSGTVSERTKTVEPVAGERATIYLIRGEDVGAASRMVEGSDEPAVLAKRTMDELVSGPTTQEAEFGLGTTIPKGTRVNEVTVAGGTATVDLSSEFQSGGGSLSMLLRVAQVVCTLTGIEGVDSVAFMIDGVRATAIGGEGVIVDPPVDRADFEGQLPPVLVESPTPGELVTSPVTISGSSNVFEAVHQVEVVDPDGAIMKSVTVQATSGTGTRGTWSTTVEYGPVKFDGLGAIIVFELSAKDGSRIDIVEIPVRMVK